MGIEDPRLARLTGIPVFLYLFDLLEFDGHDLTGLPLRQRKAALRRAFSFHGPVRYTPTATSAARPSSREAWAKGWEGLIAKRADSPYRPRAQRRLAEAEVLGRAGAGDRRLHAAAGLAPASARCWSAITRTASCASPAKSGPASAAAPWPSWATGWKRWSGALSLRRRPRPAARGPLGGAGAVGQFAFGEWTRDGKLRHPSSSACATTSRPPRSPRAATSGADCSARLGGGTHGRPACSNTRGSSDLDPGNELHAPSAKETH